MLNKTSNTKCNNIQLKTKTIVSANDMDTLDTKLNKFQ